MIIVAKWVLILFGIFLVYAGLVMLFAPAKARRTVSRAGSTGFINYAELTLRMIPAAALVIYAGYSRAPDLFILTGWFMLSTSVVLLFVPPRLHHRLALKFSEMIKPLYFQLISPFSILFGVLLIYCVT